MVLSVIVPVYNAESYLNECVESVIPDLSDDIEMILVDDGSTDGSAVLCDRYAESCSYIRVIHQENKGSVNARYKGLKAAIGRYVTFLDADDKFDKGYLNACIDELSYSKVSILVTGFTSWNSDYRKQIYNFLEPAVYSADTLRKVLFPRVLCARENPFAFGIYPSLCAKFFDRELILSEYKKAPHDISFGDDAIVTYPCFFKANYIEINNETGYLYRFNQNSMTHSFNPRLGQQCIHLSDYMKQQFKLLYSEGIDQVHAYIRDSIAKLVFINVFIRQELNYKSKVKQFSNWLDHKSIRESVFAQKLYPQDKTTRLFCFLVRHRIFLPLYMYYRWKLR